VRPHKPRPQHSGCRPFNQALSPADGDAWHSLGHSLFFAGELAEAERAYAEGLRRDPRHAKLRHEAETWRTFAPSRDPSRDGAAGGANPVDAEFLEVPLPEGSYADRPASADLHMGAEFFGAAQAG
jgi:hypothetical protein